MTIGVVGLGLIGGSIGLALRDPERVIVGFDPDSSNANLAAERSCVDRLGTLQEVAQSDVVFVAAPPAKVIEVLEQLRSLRNSETVVTDCTSVKRLVADWGLTAQDPMFVPGHPMAGHEKSGPGFASAWMFKGARWILSPLPITSPKALKAVEALVKAMGAKPIRVPAGRHDHHVAVVSHLPHALAGLLLILADQLEDEDVAGGSWRDLTRVGGVDPGLWTQIFMANRVELEKVLTDMSKGLAQLESNLRDGDESAVREFLALAREAKSRQRTPIQAAPSKAPAKSPRTRRRT
jgi:prephenate dehydrogenase